MLVDVDTRLWTCTRTNQVAMNGDGGDFCLIPVAVAAKAGSARQDWIFGDGGKEIQN